MDWELVVVHTVGAAVHRKKEQLDIHMGHTAVE